MNYHNNNALPCAVFGHNYIKTKNNLDQTAELTCNHCGVVVNTDIDGNFEDITNPDKHIHSTLRRLFHLKLQLLKSTLSS